MVRTLSCVVRRSVRLFAGKLLALPVRATGPYSVEGLLVHRAANGSAQVCRYYLLEDVIGHRTVGVQVLLYVLAGLCDPRTESDGIDQGYAGKGDPFEEVCTQHRSAAYVVPCHRW